MVRISLLWPVRGILYGPSDSSALTWSKHDMTVLKCQFPERACCEATTGDHTFLSFDGDLHHYSICQAEHSTSPGRKSACACHNPRPTSCERTRLSHGEKSSILRQALEF